MRIIFIALLALLLTACGGNGGGSATTTPPPANSGVYTPVYDIQGAGQRSPFIDMPVSISAIVTGDFQDNDSNDSNNLGGFYVQESVPDSASDTSDGVFVFDGDNPLVDVSVGDRVVVEGTVKEYFGETQLSATTVEVVGSGSIQPADINLPVALLTNNSDAVPIADLERYEGMLVRFPQALTVNDLYSLDRFGEVQLSQQGRSYSYTNQNPPDVVGFAAEAQSFAAQSILLDDGRRSSNSSPVRYLHAGVATGYSIRSGDTISGLTGNLRYSRGRASYGLETYRVMPTVDPQFESRNPRPGPPVLDGEFRVANINMLNYFLTADTGQSICGPEGNSSCRGANSDEELSRQFAKMITALSLMNADVIALIEIENNDSESLQLIVDGLNDKLGSATYAYVSTGTIGTDAIKAGFLFRSATTSLVGAFATLDSSVDSRFVDTKNRVTLAQTFSQTSGGGKLTIAVNHFKSKGSDCNSLGDPDLGNGQGNCNRTRTDAAAALADWLALDPTTSGDPDFLIIGDLNAYLAEDPLDALKNAGYVNLLEAAHGGAAYSFAFGSRFGALDHALATPSLLPQIAAVMEWHINADEPPMLDYNLEFGRDPTLFDADSPYRVSDHDPIIIGIDLSNL
jgi:predicted extracellular nuclease